MPTIAPVARPATPPSLPPVEPASTRFMSPAARKALEVFAQRLPAVPEADRRALAGLVSSFEMRPGLANSAQDGVSLLDRPWVRRYADDVKQWNALIDKHAGKPGVAELALREKRRPGLMATELLKELGVLERNGWDPDGFEPAPPPRTRAVYTGDRPVDPGPPLVQDVQERLEFLGPHLKPVFAKLPYEARTQLLKALEVFVVRPTLSDTMQGKSFTFNPDRHESAARGAVREWNAIVKAYGPHVPQLAAWRLTYDGLARDAKGLKVTQLLRTLGMPLALLPEYAR